VSPQYLIHLVGVVLNKGWVLKFQIVQEDYDLVRVLIVARNGPRRPLDLYSNELSEIVDKIRLVLGHNCRVKCEFVDRIDATVSGKYRYTISKVDRDSSPVCIVG
jgi:phenylacetate-CoA ligase